MATHRFSITYTAYDVITTPAADDHDPICIGDTVIYDSPEGNLHIDWIENVFDRDCCDGGDELTVVTEGSYRGECSLTLPDGTVQRLPGRGTEDRTEKGEEG